MPRIQNAGRYTCIMIASSTEAFPSSRELPAQPLQMSGLGGGVTIKPPPIWIDNVSCYTPAILTVSTWAQNWTTVSKMYHHTKKWKIISGGRCIRRFCHTRINIQSYLSFGHLHRNCSFQHGLSSRSKQVWSLTQLSSQILEATNIVRPRSINSSALLNLTQVELN